MVHSDSEHAIESMKHVDSTLICFILSTLQYKTQDIVDRSTVKFHGPGLRQRAAQAAESKRKKKPCILLLNKRCLSKNGVRQVIKPTVCSGEYSGVYRNSSDLGVRVHFETVDSVCPLQVATHIDHTHAFLCVI